MCVLVEFNGKTHGYDGKLRIRRDTCWSYHIDSETYNSRFRDALLRIQFHLQSSLSGVVTVISRLTSESMICCNTPVNTGITVACWGHDGPKAVAFCNPV